MGAQGAFQENSLDDPGVSAKKSGFFEKIPAF
jgi:hypothetical protein